MCGGRARVNKNREESERLTKGFFSPGWFDDFVSTIAGRGAADDGAMRAPTTNVLWRSPYFGPIARNKATKRAHCGETGGIVRSNQVPTRHSVHSRLAGWFLNEEFLFQSRVRVKFYSTRKIRGMTHAIGTRRSTVIKMAVAEAVEYISSFEGLLLQYSYCYGIIVVIILFISKEILKGLLRFEEILDGVCEFLATNISKH